MHPFPDGAQPCDMARQPVHGESHQLAIEFLELFLHLAEGHELRGADRGEVRRMAEQDYPTAAVIDRKVYRTLSGCRPESRCGVADARHHVHFVFHNKSCFDECVLVLVRCGKDCACCRLQGILFVR